MGVETRALAQRLDRKRCTAFVLPNYARGSAGHGTSRRCNKPSKKGSRFCGIHLRAGVRNMEPVKMRLLALTERQWSVLWRWSRQRGLHSRTAALQDILNELAV